MFHFKVGIGDKGCFFFKTNSVPTVINFICDQLAVICDQLNGYLILLLG